MGLTTMLAKLQEQIGMRVFAIETFNAPAVTGSIHPQSSQLADVALNTTTVNRPVPAVHPINGCHYSLGSADVARLAC
jgi:hypothetical protein